MTGIKYTSEDLHDHDAVAAVIKNANGEILMQEHVKYGFWTIPIGKAKHGQSPEDGMRQELFEECDIIVDSYDKLTSRNYSYIRDGREVKLTGHLFMIITYRGDIINKEPHKHKQQVFLSLDKISELPFLSDMTLLYLETLGMKRKDQI